MFLSYNENQLVSLDVIHLMEIGSICEMKTFFEKWKNSFSSSHEVEYLLKCKVYILQKTWDNNRQPFGNLRIGISIDIVIIFNKAIWVFASTCPLVFRKKLLRECLETNLVKHSWFKSFLVHLLTFLWIFQEVEQFFCGESTIACFFKKWFHNRCYRRNFSSL